MFYFHQTLQSRLAAQPHLIELNRKWSRVVHKTAALSQTYAQCGENNLRIHKQQ